MKIARLLVAMTTLAVVGMYVVAGESFGAAASLQVKNGKIAFRDQNGYLKVINPDGSGTRTLTRSGTKTITAFAWAPNGRHIAFLRGDLGTVTTNARPANLSLFVIGADGHGERRLANCGSSCGRLGGLLVGGFSWSPDSRKIVFPRNGLTVIDVRSGQLRRLPGTKGPYPESRFSEIPNWSPDGSRIAYSYAGSLFIVPAVGKRGPRRVATHLSDVTAPSWAPDGQTIMFNGRGGIYTLRPDGSELRRLPAGTFPSWSPDGKRILYFHMSRRPWRLTAEVWTMSATGTERKRLYHSRCCVGNEVRPIWSPDGRKILFSAYIGPHKAGRSGLIVMSADGSQPHRLLPFSADVAWQPIR